MTNSGPPIPLSPSPTEEPTSLPVLEVQPIRLRTWLIASIIVNVLLAVFGRGSLPHQVLISGIICCGGLPALAICIFTFMIQADAKRQPASSVTHDCFLFACTIGSTLLSFPVGYFLLEQDVNSAKQHCEKLIPRIEEYRILHGQYPESLDQLGEMDPLPSLLQGCQYYESSGKEYRFTFYHPRDSWESLYWESTERRWYSTD